jgi:hypothetical protein
MDYNYSQDYLIAVAFEKELTNNLLCSIIEENDEKKKVIIEYMERRIKEIKERYK